MMTFTALVLASTLGQMHTPIKAEATKYGVAEATVSLDISGPPVIGQAQYLWFQAAPSTNLYLTPTVNAVVAIGNFQSDWHFGDVWMGVFPVFTILWVTGPL